jgi:hypothetical protein
MKVQLFLCPSRTYIREMEIEVLVNVTLRRLSPEEGAPVPNEW